MRVRFSLFLISLLGIVFVFIIWVPVVSAATVFLLPKTGDFSVGQSLI